LTRRDNPGANAAWKVFCDVKINRKDLKTHKKNGLKRSCVRFQPV